MEYNKIFGYNQSALVKYNVTLSEARLLSYLSQYFDSGNAKAINVNGRLYYMIYYSKILTDNEALQISYDSLRKKIKSLEDRGFVTKHKEDINSSTLYLKINDSKLKTHIGHKNIRGTDELLATFIKENWRVKRNYSSEINIFDTRLEYTHTYIKNSVLKYLNGEYFIYKLRENLNSSIPQKWCGYLKALDVQLINNKIELSTQNNANYYEFFVDNYSTIEKAICLSYIETIKQM